ncbi:hypothetical protein TREMEDRAFT_59602 [Tremella mesenterica DSM 1558]|uniref:uncharacterized protein n=1 Tax=Tremella mesenterica (strain ATCC 24925 / CBS 8224 / DSM 1558 / NBRC 9311 / NRRL Y-6157 / RJB 2259-6 / UBC 559-6) TaxID=578456 RepID=UPI0003F48FB3|nr:uncharacterized protein TREMEDRAFT_59602 [Tremella mesenterica DSM 1558]EIW73437.1 hypothetical protein TREMEDRAFT_59602 [Tremella mesenterica DSM 1558]
MEGMRGRHGIKTLNQPPETFATPYTLPMSTLRIDTSFTQQWNQARISSAGIGHLSRTPVFRPRILAVTLHGLEAEAVEQNCKVEGTWLWPYADGKQPLPQGTQLSVNLEVSVPPDRLCTLCVTPLHEACWIVKWNEDIATLVHPEHFGLREDGQLQVLTNMEWEPDVSGLEQEADVSTRWRGSRSNPHALDPNRVDENCVKFNWLKPHHIIKGLPPGTLVSTSFKNLDQKETLCAICDTIVDRGVWLVSPYEDFAVMVHSKDINVTMQRGVPCVMFAPKTASSTQAGWTFSAQERGKDNDTTNTSPNFCSWRVKAKGHRKIKPNVITQCCKIQDWLTPVYQYSESKTELPRGTRISETFFIEWYPDLPCPICKTEIQSGVWVIQLKTDIATMVHASDIITVREGSRARYALQAGEKPPPMALPSPAGSS